MVGTLLGPCLMVLRVFTSDTQMKFSSSKVQTRYQRLKLSEHCTNTCTCAVAQVYASIPLALCAGLLALHMFLKEDVRFPTGVFPMAGLTRGPAVTVCRLGWQEPQQDIQRPLA